MKAARAGARSAACGVAAAGAIVMLVDGCEHSAAAPERTCSGAQAIRVADLTGTSLPMKHIALTFDDGPGVRASELSSHLKSEGIRAGFFVNGKMLGGNAGVLAQIIADCLPSLQVPQNNRRARP